MGHVSRAEALVLKLYLESTGLIDLVEPEDAVSIIWWHLFFWYPYIPILIFQFSYLVETLHLWIEYDIGLATIRNGGISKNLIYFIDETFRELNEDFLTSFYNICENAKYIDVVARYAIFIRNPICRVEVDFFTDFMRILRKIYQYRFDEIELALLIQLLFLKIGNSNIMDYRDGLANEFPCKNLNKKYMAEAYKKEIFLALQKYYERSGIDYSLRLGDLIFVFTELQVWLRDAWKFYF